MESEIKVVEVSIRKLHLLILVLIIVLIALSPLPVIPFTYIESTELLALNEYPVKSRSFTYRSAYVPAGRTIHFEVKASEAVKVYVLSRDEFKNFLSNKPVSGAVGEGTKVKLSLKVDKGDTYYFVIQVLPTSTKNIVITAAARISLPKTEHISLVELVSKLGVHVKIALMAVIIGKLLTLYLVIVRKH